jgi:hypothetical protein
MKRLFLLLFFAGLVYSTTGQDINTTIRGIVVDMYNNLPLTGANVLLHNESSKTGTTTNTEGRFEFKLVPVGRHSINVTYVGYKSVKLENIMLVSGKETILHIQLEEEPVQLSEVVISPNKQGATNNEMVYISGRSFNVEETERYAGTNGDPARMASYFAGVMPSGDTRNDIIIRGNSPLGLLWRLEGVDIPNPNHFAAAGTNGGPICILNNNQLSNSDFITSAFPARYGNALSGVFDLKMRNGNNQKRENTIQFGTNGLEAGIEGYFTKTSNASYMINYRNAFLEFFDKVGVDLDLPTIPKYRDISFKLSFPSKMGMVSLWGLGGKSSLEMFSDKNEMSTIRNINTYFGSMMGAAGLSHSFSFNPNSYIKTSLAVTGLNSYMRADSALPVSTPYTIYGSKFSEIRTIITSTYHLKASPKLRITSGMTYTREFADLIDTAKNENTFFTITDINDNFGLLQSHVQGEYAFNNKLKFNAGVHFQYLTFNKRFSVEPRAAIRYEVNPKLNFRLAYGLHSQKQQNNVYFFRLLVDTLNLVYKETNNNLDFSKSHHVAVGTGWYLIPGLKLNVEMYYQYLFDIPVETKPSSYSAINYGTDFFSVVKDSLQNTGIGYNTGVELSLEQFYNKGFYYMANISLFTSKYRGSNNHWYGTLFNNNYVVNLLGGYEFTLQKNNFLSINGNLAWAGGLRYTPININESVREGEAVYFDNRAFEGQYKDYLKMNLKFIYRVNRKKYSYESAFGITNLTNRKNILQQSFDPATGTIVHDYQLGLMPEGTFRIYF